MYCLVTVAAYSAIALFAIICILFLYFKYKYGYWARKGVPFVKPSIPFGNVQELFLRKKCIAEISRDIYNELKSRECKFGGFYFLNTPIYMPISPDHVKHVLSLDFDHFSERGTYFDEDKDPLAANLFNLPTEKWKKLRAKMTPQFTAGKLKGIFDVIVKCSESLADVCTMENEPLDINDVAVRYTVDVIGNCVFGIECDSLRNPTEEFRVIAEHVINPPPWNGLMFHMSLMSSDLLKLGRFRILQNTVTQFFLDIFKQTIRYRCDSKLRRNDFMQLLIDMMDKDLETRGTGTDLHMTQMLAAAQAFVFFAAGFETSSMTVSLCLYEVSRAQNAHIQDCVHAEVVRVLAEHGGRLTYDALMAMTYLDKIIQETLRKYPTLAFLNRVCTKSYKIPGSDVRLEKGTRVFISLFGLQSDPEYFSDPDKFDPGRFSEEAKSTRTAFTYIPFGEGRRICIGARFGLLQTKVCLATLFANFRFTLNSRTRVPVTFQPTSFVLSLRDKIWLNAERLR